MTLKKSQKMTVCKYLEVLMRFQLYPPINETINSLGDFTIKY